MFDGFLEGLLSVAFLPIHLVLAPIDMLLSQISGLDVIPRYIGEVTTLVSTIPSTLVSLSGLNPLLYNAIISTILLYFGVVPAVNGVKKLFNWIRGA